MSDPIDEAYERYLGAHVNAGTETNITCPKCDSSDVDRRAGYRGEYRCLQCGHDWQIGGFRST